MRIDEKEAINLKETGKSHMGELEGEKRKEKCCN